jgi:RecG-like helicase
MSDFYHKRFNVLVASTIIETGIDVPSANTIIIERADKFGLAQLHQLRGRIRRSSHQAYCFLMPTAGVKPGRRLRAMEATDDGFTLAQLDLDLRGPGQIYGVAQSGVLDLRMANLSDTRLIKSARAAAHQTVDEGLKLVQYPRLQARVAELRKITNLN